MSDTLKEPIELKPYYNFIECDSDDKKVLTEIKEIFEKITGKKITLEFVNGSQSHYVFWNKFTKGYVIRSDPNHKEIDRKTAIEHELSHIIHNTLMQTFSKYSQQWIDLAV